MKRPLLIRPRGVLIKRLPLLRPMLIAWLKAVDRYVRRVSNDAPWWWNERAVLSSLAGGAWMDNGVAIEEYQSDKHDGRKTSAGRADLYIAVGKGSFEIEAKLANVGIGSGARQIKSTLETALDGARADAKKLPKGNATRLGVLFVRPWLPQRGSDLSRCIRNFLEALTSTDNDVAWMFPMSCRNFGVLEKGSRYLYPGVALMARRPKRGR